MKKLAYRGLMLFLSVALIAGSCLAAQTLVPVGRVIGLELDTAGLTVADFDRDFGKNAKKAGLQVGDTITKADGIAVKTAAELQQLVDRAQGQLILTVLREGKELSLAVEPVTLQGGQRLGIYIREGITGIGTVTYYDPDTSRFGALGHGVSNGSGSLLPMEQGAAVGAQVINIQKGRIGTPGQLRGSFTGDRILGQLERNTVCGVFGTAAEGWAGTPLPIGDEHEVHTGGAVILSSLAGDGVREYDVEIVRVYPNQESPGRNMLLHVTDPALLEITGGIVQGMSGSPLVQDGKLIGAVTHVLVNDPTMGYGIFIENMLDAAG